MPYRLDQINQAVRQDPAAFMAAGDAAFHEKVCRAADLIQFHRDKSPVDCCPVPPALARPRS